MTPVSPPVPRKIDLKKDQRLRIEWADGSESAYPVNWLRQMCPCAACRTARTGTDPHQLLQQAPRDFAHESGEATATRADGRSGPLSLRERVSRSEPQASDVTGEGGATPEQRKPLSLRVVPRELTSAADPVHVTDAQLVGNYAIQLTFSDGHTSGIYSFVYLRELGS